MIQRTRRIVVALDPAAPRAEAFEALLALCDAADADVTALFIEDDNLLRLAALPGAVEIRIQPGAAPHVLDPAAMLAQLERRAEQMRSTCQRAALDLKLRAHFSVVRGDVLAELLRAAADADILVVGRSLRSAGTRTWLGAAPERLVAALRTAGRAPALMFVHEPWHSGRSVALLDDPGEFGARALQLASALARREGLPLEHVSLTAGAEGDAGAAGGRDDRMNALRRYCARQDPRVLVVPMSDTVSDALDLAALLADLPTSILLSP
ncbi:MAG TPA: universal stress protein [Pseudomonadales bacterium]|nr:universal stress protein [Pseudomonadales bacterium]